jgi:hypothetical protein
MCSRNSAAGGSAASRNSPGRTKGAPYTNSADEMLLSSLGASLRPNSAHGRWSGQAAPASLLLRASFNCLWALSTRPLLWGWYAVVVVCVTPSLLRMAAHPSCAGNAGSRKSRPTAPGQKLSTAAGRNPASWSRNRGAARPPPLRCAAGGPPPTW